MDVTVKMTKKANSIVESTVFVVSPDSATHYGTFKKDQEHKRLRLEGGWGGTLVILDQLQITKMPPAFSLETSTL